MKRPVSLVASLLLALGVAACSGAEAGKPEIAESCNNKMNSTQGCACLADALEKGLTPAEFSQVARVMEENKRFSEMLPGSLSADPKIAGVFMEATQSCFA